jgi:AraC-like DNA-binding protein
MKYLKVPERGDPSNIAQLFSGFNINLLCCRYWWLVNWESQHMTFPYWRIYWNKSSGGFITFADKTIELNPGQIVLIPPYTSFSSRLRANNLPVSGYNLEGSRMEQDVVESSLLEKGAVLHLFIHFNLGMPFDFISPELFRFDVTPSLREDLEELSLILKHNPDDFSVSSNLLIYKIIILTVSQIPKSYWNLTTTDQRILNVLREIEDHLSEVLTNKRLAEVATMAINSFSRLFKEEIGIAPQQFVRERRIQKTSILLHHTIETIDEIAANSGFCDRFHLARVFKNSTGYSPAQYRKKFYPKN